MLAHVIQTNALGMSFCTDTSKGAGTQNLLNNNPLSTDRNFPLGAIEPGSSKSISLRFQRHSDPFLNVFRIAAGENEPGWTRSVKECV